VELRVLDFTEYKTLSFFFFFSFFFLVFKIYKFNIKLTGND
jgi:hypothetical protein